MSAKTLLHDLTHESESLTVKQKLKRFQHCLDTARLVNVVCPLVTEVRFDLNAILEKAIEMGLSCNKAAGFAGLSIKYRQENLKFTAIYFASGKINCVGLKQDDPQYLEKVVDFLKRKTQQLTGGPVGQCHKKVSNRVYTLELPHELKFPLYLFLKTPKWRNTKYNNQLFPGAITKLESVRAKLLTFSSGKIILTGVKSSLVKSLIREQLLGLFEMLFQVKQNLG